MVAEPPKVMSTCVALYAAYVFIQLLVFYALEDKHPTYCSVCDFNQAALDGALCLFLSGRLCACLQGQTGEDLGVMSNDPSTYGLSLQSRQAHAVRLRYVSHWSGNLDVNMNSHLLTQLRL